MSTDDTAPILVSGDKLDRVIALLESIDRRLAAAAEDASRCPHGGTGLCMYCVIQNDLMRPQGGGR